MPIVRIDYERNQFSEDEIQKIADAVQLFAAEATEYDPKEISVFASANQITINAAPIEIYIYATFPAASENDMETMLEKLAISILNFKKENNIETLINLSVVKMNWKFRLEV
jgi:hypothetical protein